MMLQQRDSEEDMTFLNRLFPQLIPMPAPMLVLEICLLTYVQAENGTVLSLVTASVGFTMDGFPT